MTLPVDGQVAKTLFTVEEYLTEKRYAELTELLLELAESHGRELVAVPTKKNTKSVHYLNVALYAQQIMASFPADGLAACRSRLDPSAKRWFEAWQATGDESQLQRILRSAYVSRFGDDALWELGQLAWDRGDFSLAAAYWRQLIPEAKPSAVQRLTYPDSEFSTADVSARLILCDIFALKFAAAESRIVAYRQAFPDAIGSLAGKKQPWSELLSDVLQEARTWESAGQQLMPTFGGANERQQTWPFPLDLGPVRWSKAWPVRVLPQMIAQHPRDRGPLASFPVIDGQHVFLSDGEAIHAWNILSGEPAWTNEQPDPSIIYPSVPQELDSLPSRPNLGTPWQTLTVSQGKLLARMGSPLTGAADSEHGDLVSELICLDVGQGEGKLLWKLSADDLPSGGRPWGFEGTPLVIESMAYGVLYRRRPEAEFALVAIEVATGQVQWLKSIGSARPHVEEGINRVSRLLLTSGDGRLYLSTDQGTILAFAPEDGRPLWAVSYESQPLPLQHGVPTHLQAGLLPPVFSQGLVFVAPNDGGTLFCLEAASGRIVWQRGTPNHPDRFRHILGVTAGPGPGRLIVSGNSLWAINISNGELGWRLTQDNRAEGGYGQGVLSGQSVFWPTREWLYQVDQRTGELERKLALHADAAAHSGGNLAVADGVLMVAEPDRLAVYGEYSVLKSRLKLELSQRHDQPALWRRMMDLEASIQDWDAAATAGRTAWSHRHSLPPADLISLEHAYTALLWRLIQHQMETREFSAAEQRYQELSEFPLTPAEHGRLLWGRAKLDLQREEPAQAVARLHQLLVRNEESRLEIDGRSAQTLVRDQLNLILRTSGRAAFRQIDRQGDAELTQALASGDVAAVRKVMRLYPLLETADDIWPRLITEQSRRQNWDSVWPLLEEWQRSEPGDILQGVIQERKIALLRQAGYRRAAYRLQQLESPATTDWHYTVAGWSQPLADVQRVFVPDGSPPSDRSAGVLLVGEDLALVDRITGQRRWQKPLSSPPFWAGHGETSLVLAAKDQLYAVSLETGEELWQRSCNGLAETQPIIHTFERLFVFTPEQGLTAISTITGDVLWEFKAPTGKLRSCGLLPDDVLLAQTVDPLALHWIDSISGRLVRSEAGFSQPWRQAPVGWGAGKFAVTTTDRQVLGWGPEPADRWKYAGGISHAHADPWLLTDDKSLALLIDGVTLVGIDRSRGDRLWSAGLSDAPVVDPSRQVAVTQGKAIAAWSSRIRAIDLKEGRIAWEHLLPAGIENWRLQTFQDQIAVSGSTNSTPRRAELWLLDAASGAPRQKVSHADPQADGQWHVDDLGMLWISATEIASWQPMSAVVSESRGDRESR